MSDRLTRIVTRGGDRGKTSLGDGSRVRKHNERIEAIGTVDELNSVVGMFVAEMESGSRLFDMFRQVQNDLFDIGGEFAMPGHTMVNESYWRQLEECIAALNDTLPSLENFILPGGSRAVAVCHVMRSVARRAERRVVALAEVEDVNSHSQVYLNRLSDLCFVAARSMAKERGEAEILWVQRSRE